MSTTNITVRVIAVDGKFLGDDIGGAQITIRDADTQVILAQGKTTGDSGPNGAGGVMCVKQRRGCTIPMNADPSLTNHFTASLSLSAPRRIQVTAFGPLGVPKSANTVTATTWVYPGRDITVGNGLLLELPGLICQIVQPATNTTIGPVGITVNVVAHIAMMCGCPIEDKTTGQICPCDPQPWLPADFIVFALILGASNSPMPLKWDTSKPAVAGKFIGSIPGVSAGTHQMTVFAQQISTGNTGVDFSTFTISPPSS